MKFNPEDGANFGPHCRNCHSGATGCEYCHDVNGVTPTGDQISAASGLLAATTDTALASDSTTKKSYFDASETWDIERYVEWPTDWDTTDAAVNPTCADNGFYWPHRTMGFMMLKDQLFGLDFDGTPVAVGEVRDGVPATDTWSWGDPTWRGGNDTTPGFWGEAAHDLDSVCLDCHNPNIWNATAYNDHTDDPADPSDNFDDELILRGLP